jgi:hypothetical protein
MEREEREELESGAEEESLINRTGIMTRPEMAAEMIRGAEELTGDSEADAAEIGEMRQEYLEEALPIGSEPLPLGDAEAEEALAEPEALTVLLDKLGERLAFERQGTRLYEAFLQRFELQGLEDESGPTSAELRHICDEEFDHFRYLQQAVVQFGGDATVKSPSADVAAVLSKGAVEIIADPRTSLPQCLQALLTAELADNDGWQLLGVLAEQLGLEELASRCRAAHETEQEHLEKVRNWLAAATLQAAQGAGETVMVEAEEIEVEAEEIEVEANSAESGAKRRRASSSEGHMDALELLAQDHESVKQLFEQAEAAEEDKEKRKIFKQIKKELDTHARIEESIFYPAMQQHEELKDMVLESLEEHKQIKKLLREIDRLGKTSDRFEPKLKVLEENVQHHAEEEEEGKMFPKVRELVDAAELESMADELQAAKRQRQRKAG